MAGLAPVTAPPYAARFATNRGAGVCDLPQASEAVTLRDRTRRNLQQIAPSRAPRPRRLVRVAVAVLAAAPLVVASSLFSGSPAGATSRRPHVAPGDAIAAPATTAAWCIEHGSALVGWSGTFPDLPLCGPGPDYGGTWSYVVEPGPDGEVGARYYNATPGFQCVELADRWLAVADGLAPVLAEGSQVAMNYHAAYPADTRLVENGSPQAVGHPPLRGDVISFSEVPDFQDPTDGHVAIVVSSHWDARTGNGVVEIAQQNVAPGGMRRALLLEDWRLVDPEEPPNAEWQFPYAEWLHVRVATLTLVTPRLQQAIRAGDARIAELLRFGAAGGAALLSSSRGGAVEASSNATSRLPAALQHLDVAGSAGSEPAAVPAPAPAGEPGGLPAVLLVLGGILLAGRVVVRNRRRPSLARLP